MPHIHQGINPRLDADADSGAGAGAGVHESQGYQ